MNIGEKFKTARKEKGITLEEIQKNTKIRTKYLEAIEENDFNVIPGKVYVKAFIKEYARQLDLDTEELIREYQNIVNIRRVKEAKEVTENNDKKKSNSNNIIRFLIIAAVIITLILTSYYIYITKIKNENISQKNEILDSTTETENIPVNEVNNNDVSDIKTTIIASEESWLQVKVDGENVFQGIIARDERMDFSPANTLEIKIGNGAGIKIQTAHQIFGPFGSSGDVINFKVEYKKRTQ